MYRIEHLNAATTAAEIEAVTASYKTLTEPISQEELQVVRYAYQRLDIKTFMENVTIDPAVAMDHGQVRDLLRQLLAKPYDQRQLGRVAGFTFAMDWQARRVIGVSKE